MDTPPSVQIGFEFEEPTPRGYVGASTALAAYHDAVRATIFKTICHVNIRLVDTILVKIIYRFQSNVKSWKAPKNLQPILNACYQGRIEERLEKTVYKYAQSDGIVKLAIAISHDRRILCELDSLGDEDLIELVTFLHLIPGNAYIKSLQGCPSMLLPYS
jgi:hypothetical protein